MANETMTDCEQLLNELCRTGTGAQNLTLEQVEIIATEIEKSGNVRLANFIRTIENPVFVNAGSICSIFARKLRYRTKQLKLFGSINISEFQIRVHRFQ